MDIILDENYERTFLIKMAICSDNENQLLKFLSICIDNEENSLSFNNLLSMIPEMLMIRQNPIQSILQWRLSNWGIAYDCDSIVKDVKSVETVFEQKELRKYNEYLQYTTLSNIPAKLFLKLSNHFTDLKFILIFIRNDLFVCGQLMIEKGQILDRTVIEGFNETTIRVSRLMYDENYPNIKYGII